MTYDILTCPACGGNNLHHHAVGIYNRNKEDSPTGTFVGVTYHNVVRSTYVDGNDGNPSLRRNGIRVWLNCENCADITTLDIAQHKGETHVTKGVASTTQITQGDVK